MIIIAAGSFYTFLCGSHAVGWALVAQQARSRKFVDLCQFVRAFIIAPFVFVGAVFLITGMGFLIWKVLIPNILTVLLVIATIVGSCVILGGLGFLVISPAIKKVYGVAKPFSERICIVLYRSTK